MRCTSGPLPGTSLSYTDESGGERPWLIRTWTAARRHGRVRLASPDLARTSRHGRPASSHRPGPATAQAPEVPGPQPELPDAFAPGLSLNAVGDPALDAAGAEPGEAGDPYGPPDDLDTDDAYDPAEEDGAADPYDPASYGQLLAW